jgi:hypothetical protein
MGNKNNSQSKANHSQQIMPSNILIKLSCADKLHLLSQKDRGILFTNMFNYHTGEELMKMSPSAEMFFIDMTEVFEYNKIKYAAMVERNRNNGEKNNGSTKKTQTDPVAISGMPNGPKDRDIDKSKNKEKEKSIVEEKLIEKVPVIAKVEVAENATRNVKTLKENYKKIYEIDFRTINDNSDKYFCYDVDELVDTLGWDRFIYLASTSNIQRIPEILEEFSHPELTSKLIKVIRDSSYYFDKLLK